MPMALNIWKRGNGNIAFLHSEENFGIDEFKYASQVEKTTTSCILSNPDCYEGYIVVVKVSIHMSVQRAQHGVFHFLGITIG